MLRSMLLWGGTLERATVDLSYIAGAAMKPSESLNAHLDQVLKTISRYPVRNPMLFGSAARGDDAEASDLDLLVEANDGATYYDLAGLEIELEAILGCEVDVVTVGCLARDVFDRAVTDLKPLR